MMNREQVKKLFKRIKDFYDLFEVSSEKVDIWTGLLKNFECEMVMNNLDRHIVSSKYPPTIADLVNEPEKEIPSGPAIPTVEETNEMLRERARNKRNAARPEVREQALAEIRKILNIPDEVKTND
jgi:Loader and inhibitor of phage G40P